MADGATSLWRSLAGRTKRKRLPHLCSIQAWILATGYDLERCCRCKNQWNKLAGRSKRAAASAPSTAKSRKRPRAEALPESAASSGADPTR